MAKVLVVGAANSALFTQNPFLKACAYGNRHPIPMDHVLTVSYQELAST